MPNLRKIAMRCPGVTEGIACAGTSLERITFKTRHKAFLFLGNTDAMVKLDGSLAEAARLAAKQPDGIRVGANGWVKIIFRADGSDVPAEIEKWIEESYHLMGGGAATSTMQRKSTSAKKTAKKPAKKIAKKKR
jgi:hypothetical protein